MKIGAIISFLETVAHPSLQETYDNAGLLTGDPDWECTGIVCALDATAEVIEEAARQQCNLVIAHHPVIFKGIKKINERDYAGRAIVRSIKQDIAIYAIHTNLDNMVDGVSGRMADLLGLKNVRVLSPKENTLRKLYTYVPEAHVTKLRQAIFEAGGGEIGNYTECSFTSPGTGTFKAGTGANPFVGEIGSQHQEAEARIEMIFPSFLENSIIRALKAAHPYEEAAYDISPLINGHPGMGAGVIGDLETPEEAQQFLDRLKKLFRLKMLRHTPFIGKPVQKVALCGGAGSFLISKALAVGADVYVTADLKYHEFFDANGRMLLADIGHYESEQFTINLLQEILRQKFPTFAVLKTTVNTNPVQYC